MFVQAACCSSSPTTTPRPSLLLQQARTVHAYSHLTRYTMPGHGTAQGAMHLRNPRHPAVCPGGSGPSAPSAGSAL